MDQAKEAGKRSQPNLSDADVSPEDDDAQPEGTSSSDEHDGAGLTGLDSPTYGTGAEGGEAAFGGGRNRDIESNLARPTYDRGLLSAVATALVLFSILGFVLTRRDVASLRAAVAAQGEKIESIGSRIDINVPRSAGALERNGAALENRAAEAYTRTPFPTATFLAER
ncbi:MAG TPA: hypothetical protein VF911_11140, partial [Thermoanaerobaculia bacterium]